MEIAGVGTAVATAGFRPCVGGPIEITSGPNCFVCGACPPAFSGTDNALLALAAAEVLGMLAFDAVGFGWSIVDESEDPNRLARA